MWESEYCSTAARRDLTHSHCRTHPDQAGREARDRSDVTLAIRFAETRGITTSVSESGESELIAQELSGLGHKLTEFEKRLTEVEKVNARLELAALTTARALQEVSQHWDSVYEAMRRIEEPGVKELRRERDSSLSPPERKS